MKIVLNNSQKMKKYLLNLINDDLTKHIMVLSDYEKRMKKKSESSYWEKRANAQRKKIATIDKHREKVLTLK